MEAMENFTINSNLSKLSMIDENPTLTYSCLNPLADRFVLFTSSQLSMNTLTSICLLPDGFLTLVSHLSSLTHLKLRSIFPRNDVSSSWTQQYY